ncbi:MAG: GTPase ObgE [Acholeplasmataceae bacterium]|nr:GTPase ObgE [Acholeplasmataceae bacterium]
MFKDLVVINVKAGKGGNGIVAFRREKYVEFGGPAGGDGGQGGDIIFEASEDLNTLIDFSYNRHLVAGDGENGLNKNKKGKDGQDVVFKVPLGTEVYDDNKELLLFDFITNGQRETIAKGGRGGRGNTSFKTHKNPAPHYSENGDLGEELKLRLELKVLADVGLIGLPNAGKSTLIGALSNAKPKVDSYPFTTLNPHLGIVRLDYQKSFVMADLPGLISGAHQGSGLGIKFLKHIERCRVLLHLISMDENENKDPYQAYLEINGELEKYNKELLTRPMLIAATKMDLNNSKKQFKLLKAKLGDKNVYDISVFDNHNINKLKYALYDEVVKIPPQKVKKTHQLYHLKEESFYTIKKAEDGVYELSGEGLKKVFLRTNFNNPEGVKRFAYQLNKYGITAELRNRGVKKGDEVRIFDYLFEMRD